jgi:hypothetical protein
MRVIDSETERQRVHEADVITGFEPSIEEQRDAAFRREIALKRELIALRLKEKEQKQEHLAVREPELDWSAFFVCAVQAWPAGVMFGGLAYLLFLLAEIFAGNWLAWLIGLFALGAGLNALTAFGLPFVALRRSP